jgi:hypothetical protein
MSMLPSAPDALALFAQCLKKVPDPDEVSAEEFQTHILGHWEVEIVFMGEG